MTLDRARLDALYDAWNRPEFIPPDPLETLLPYADPGDREIAGLAAAALAYGRVSALLPPLRRTLAALGPSPREAVVRLSEAGLRAVLGGIVHRFAGPAELAALLAGAGAVVRGRGSLEAAFLDGYAAGNDVVEGLSALTGAVRRGASGDPGHLLSRPEKGSACKRLMLYLRWMVRRDAVDPGGWRGVDPARLVMPLDTWIHRIALEAGWTRRRSADMRTARETTAALARLNPADPCRYDFALSRFGIRRDLSLADLAPPGAP